MGGKRQKAVVKKETTGQSNGDGAQPTLTDTQVEILANRIAEKEVEARERIQVIRDLFPENLEQMLMQGRVPASMVLDVTDYITWWKAGETNEDGTEIDLAEVQLTTLLRLLIGKDGAARYETLAAYEANREKKEVEEEGGL
jgi:hypothetical protein